VCIKKIRKAGMGPIITSVAPITKDVIDILSVVGLTDEQTCQICRKGGVYSEGSQAKRTGELNVDNVSLFISAGIRSMSFIYILYRLTWY
jgi:hypothetical protein